MRGDENVVVVLRLNVERFEVFKECAEDKGMTLEEFCIQAADARCLAIINAPVDA